MGPDRFTRASRTALVLMLMAMTLAALNDRNPMIVGMCAMAMLIAVLIVAFAYGKS